MHGAQGSELVDVEILSEISAVEGQDKGRAGLGRNQSIPGMGMSPPSHS